MIILLVINEMQIKTTMFYNYTPIRITKIKIKKISSIVKDVEQINSHMWLREWKTDWQNLIKLIYECTMTPQFYSQDSPK